MDFKTTTEYSFDVVKDFSVFNIFRVKFYRHVKWMFAVLALVLLAVCIFMAIEYQTYTFVVVEFLFLFMFYYFFYLFPKKAYSLVKGLKITYIFKNDGIDILSAHENGSVDSVKYGYDQLNIVYNTEKYIYLFLNRMQSYIIDKSTLSDEEAQWLESHIKSRIYDKTYKDWK